MTKQTKSAVVKSLKEMSKIITQYEKEMKAYLKEVLKPSPINTDKLIARAQKAMKQIKQTA